MSKKTEFDPKITRVKLNPEQAVLWCQCYNAGWYHGSRALYFTSGAEGAGCYSGSRGSGEGAVCASSGSSTVSYGRISGATSS